MSYQIGKGEILASMIAITIGTFMMYFGIFETINKYKETKNE